MSFKEPGKELNTSSVLISNLSSSNPSNGETRRAPRSCPWTNEEDHQLISCIQKKPRNRWSKIAEMLGGKRTASQCCQRWHRLINPRIGGSGWNEQQDELLLRLISIYGISLWTKVSKNFPGKTDVQCRLRYIQIMRTCNPIFQPISSDKGGEFTFPRNIPIWRIGKSTHPLSLLVYNPIIGSFMRVATSEFNNYTEKQPFNNSHDYPTCPFPQVYQTKSDYIPEKSFTRDPRMDINSLLS